MYQDRILIPCLDGYASGVNKLDGYVVLDTVNSSPVPIGRFAGFSITVSCPSTGTPSFAAKVQGCNDLERIDGTPDAGLTNWFDVNAGGSRIVSATISGAAVVQLTDPQPFYRWLRIVLTRTSGTMTATVKIQRKDLR